MRGRRTIDTAERAGLDPEGGKWVVICEGHSTVVNVNTLREARATTTADFCESCMDEQSAPTHNHKES